MGLGSALGVPQQMHGRAELLGLREHVPSQLLLRVGGLVVRRPVRLELPASVCYA